MLRVNLICCLALVFPSTHSYAQLHTIEQNGRIVKEIDQPNNIERYGIDYELKDYVFNSSDSSILHSIDLNALEQFRNSDSDIEVTDPSTGLTVILFWEKRKKTRVDELNLKE